MKKLFTLFSAVTATMLGSVSLGYGADPSSFKLQRITEAPGSSDANSRFSVTKMLGVSADGQRLVFGGFEFVRSTIPSSFVLHVSYRSSASHAVFPFSIGERDSNMDARAGKVLTQFQRSELPGPLPADPTGVGAVAYTINLDTGTRELSNLYLPDEDEVDETTPYVLPTAMSKNGRYLAGNSPFTLNERIAVKDLETGTTAAGEFPFDIPLPGAALGHARNIRVHAVANDGRSVLVSMDISGSVGTGANRKSVNLEAIGIFDIFSLSLRVIESSTDSTGNYICDAQSYDDLVASENLETIAFRRRCGREDAFVYELANGRVTNISASLPLLPGTYFDFIEGLAISPNGRFVGFSREMSDEKRSNLSADGYLYALDSGSLIHLNAASPRTPIFLDIAENISNDGEILFKAFVLLDAPGLKPIDQFQSGQAVYTFRSDLCPATPKNHPGVCGCAAPDAILPTGALECGAPFGAGGNGTGDGSPGTGKGSFTLRAALKGSTVTCQAAGAGLPTGAADILVQKKKGAPTKIIAGASFDGSGKAVATVKKAKAGSLISCSAGGVTSKAVKVPVKATARK